MTTEELLEDQRQETREIVEMLLEDGSDPDADYMIEHHFACTNFDRLEKAAVEAFKLGFEVEDAEEVDMEGGGVIYVFDAVSHHKLDIELLDQACEQLIHLCAKLKVDYEGWGTYYIGDDAIDMTGEDDA